MIVILQGDITTQSVDVIVNAANESLLGGGLTAETDFDEIRYVCFSAADEALYKEVFQTLGSG